MPNTYTSVYTHYLKCDKPYYEHPDETKRKADERRQRERASSDARWDSLVDAIVERLERDLSFEPWTEDHRCWQHGRHMAYRIGRTGFLGDLSLVYESFYPDEDFFTDEAWAYLHKEEKRLMREDCARYRKEHYPPEPIQVLPDVCATFWVNLHDLKKQMPKRKSWPDYQIYKPAGFPKLYLAGICLDTATGHVRLLPGEGEAAATDLDVIDAEFDFQAHIVTNTLVDLAKFIRGSVYVEWLSNYTLRFYEGNFVHTVKLEVDL